MRKATVPSSHPAILRLALLAFVAAIAAPAAVGDSPWSLAPLARPAVPPGANHPIDAFIQARLAQEGIAPAPPADLRSLLRRLHYDLTGLPPTIDDVESFAAECAARGIDGRRYPWGNEAPDPRRARFAAGWHGTAPVDAHPAGASPYGVLDMAGNAWEWVSSAYRPYPYRSDDGREDPLPGSVRATRGGGQDSSAAEITTTQRGRNLSRNPAAGHHNIGFRCAR